MVRSKRNYEAYLKSGTFLLRGRNIFGQVSGLNTNAIISAPLKRVYKTYNIKSFGQHLKSTFITKVNCEIRKGDEIKIICSRFLKISHTGGKEN